MPFSEMYREIYEDVIRPLANEIGLKSLRADEIFGSKAIMEDILKTIAKSKIVIADVTNRNPNVFYELGISHTVKDNVIIITQSMDDVPFDLQHLRCIKYSQTLRGSQELKSKLLHTIEAILHIDSLSFDKKRRAITFRGRSIKLTPHEAIIVDLFLSDSTVTHEEILLAINSKTAANNAAEVTRPLISRLNSKIKKAWGEEITIESVRGVGYYLGTK